MKPRVPTLILISSGFQFQPSLLVSVRLGHLFNCFETQIAQLSEKWGKRSSGFVTKGNGTVTGRIGVKLSDSDRYCSEMVPVTPHTGWLSPWSQGLFSILPSPWDLLLAGICQVEHILGTGE